MVLSESSSQTLQFFFEKKNTHTHTKARLTRARASRRPLATYLVELLLFAPFDEDDED